MLKTALWVQLRVIYNENDYWTYEGMVHISWYRNWKPFGRASDWAHELQLRSTVAISRWVLWAYNRLCTKVLGIKAKYEEYEIFALLGVSV
jgi:hypothetical protein